MINSHTTTLSHLQTIVTEIGERPAGTNANHKAKDYIRRIFSKKSVTVEEIAIDFPAWSCHQTNLRLGDEILAVATNPFSPSCDVSAFVVPVGTIDELESVDLENRIVLLYGELSSAPLFPIGFTIYNPERDKTINRLLIEKMPLAILTSNPTLFKQQHIIEDFDMPIPSATISPVSSLHILKQSNEVAHLKITTQIETSKAVTLKANQSRQNKKRIVICAHYDTKFGTPGAYDNGSGIAVLLSVFEKLTEQRFTVDLEFVAWGDEEYGGGTDRAYSEQANFDDILCVINIDGVGQYTGTNTVTMLAQSEAFQKKVKTISQEMQGIAWVEPWYASNHYTFFAQGVPCIALGSIGTDTLHQANDTIDWISPEKLEEVIDFVCTLVNHIQYENVNLARSNTN